MVHSVTLHARTTSSVAVPSAPMCAMASAARRVVRRWRRNPPRIAVDQNAGVLGAMRPFAILYDDRFHA